MEYEELRVKILSRGVKSTDASFSISAGETKTVFHLRGPLIMMKALLVLTDKDAKASWEMDSLKLTYSPYEIFSLGLDDVNPVTPFITKYDTTNNIYSIEWVPAGGMLVNNYIKLSVTAVNDTTAHVIAYYY